MRKNLHNLTIEQIQQLDEHIRLVILHPNYINRYTVLGDLLDDTALYVRFEGDKLSTDDKHDQLAAAFQVQVDSAKLSQIKTIILDEYDRSDPKRAEKFLPVVLDSYPNARIVLLTRSIPPGVLKNQELRSQAAFVPAEKALMLQDYASIEDDRMILEVRAFGEGTVILNGNPITSWDGVLPRSLFFYLVDRGMVTRSEIFDTFWPTLSTSEATNVFHVTKRKISEILGVELTKYWSGFYRISPDIDVHYDVLLFNELMQNSGIAEDPADALDKARRAVGLYRGHFLNMLNTAWVQQRRMELNYDYSDALYNLAELYEQAGEDERALSCYVRAFAHNRTQTEIMSHITRLYETLGMPVDELEEYLAAETPDLSRQAVS